MQSSRLAEPVATGEPAQFAQINVVRRLGLYVFANHQTGNPAAAAGRDHHRPLRADGHRRRPTLKNPSPYMRSVGSGSLQLTALSGGKPHAIPIRPFRLLPETETTIDVAVPAKLKLGDANVLAVRGLRQPRNCWWASNG